MTTRRVGIMTAAIGLVYLYALGANADGAPSRFITDLIQEGQGVRITMTTPSQGISQSAFYIHRTQGTESLALLFHPPFNTWQGQGCAYNSNSDPNQLHVTPDEICARYPAECLDCDEDEVAECYGEACDSCEVDWYYIYDDDFCNELPFYCVDCNDDGRLDCPFGCVDSQVYEFYDPCVEPGVTQYRISWYGTSRTLDVVDTGVDCDETDIDTDVDTDSGEIDEPDGGPPPEPDQCDEGAGNASDGAPATCSASLLGGSSPATFWGSLISLMGWIPK